MGQVRPLMIDLCCGLQGASKPARDRGWRVVTLDLLDWVKPSIVGDLYALPLKRDLAPDLLWISPDCTPYTLWRLPWHGNPIPDTGLMISAAAAVRWLRPRAWVIENVRAAEQWCRPFLGTPILKVHGHCFWTDLFTLLPRVAPHKGMIPGHCKDTHQRRSIIPYEVALQFVLAAERRAGLAERRLPSPERL